MYLKGSLEFYFWGIRRQTLLSIFRIVQQYCVYFKMIRNCLTLTLSSFCITFLFFQKWALKAWFPCSCWSRWRCCRCWWRDWSHCQPIQFHSQLHSAEIYQYLKQKKDDKDQAEGAKKEASNKKEVKSDSIKLWYLFWIITVISLSEIIINACNIIIQTN